MARVSNTGASEGTPNFANKANKKKVRYSPETSDSKLTLSQRPADDSGDDGQGIGTEPPNPKVYINFTFRIEG
jgi:hypothetical protein